MPGVFALIQRGWNLYIPHIKQYLGYLIIFFAAAELSNLIALFYQPTLGTLLARNWKEFISFLLVTIPMFVLFFSIGMMIIGAMYARQNNKDAKWRGMLSLVLRRFWPSVGAYLAASVTIGAGFALLMISSGRIVLTILSGQQQANAVLYGVGTAGIILSIAGIILYLHWMFGYLETLLQGKRTTEALAVSYRLVRGRFWHVLWLVLATSVILFALGYLVGTILSALLQTIPYAPLTGPTGSAIVKTTTATLVGAATAPWGYGITLSLYEALKQMSTKE